MRTNLITLPLIMSLLAVVGCENKSDSKQTSRDAAPASSQSVGHAPAGAKPGSHEDWCGGHQVPESMCTRCNPSLIAAFKATGDWCEGHGLPESQCLKCNPDLKIERPPKAGEK